MIKTLPASLAALLLALSQADAQAAPVFYTFTDLGTLGGTYSTAHAINNSGQVAGDSSLLGSGQSHATVWIGEKPVDLGTLGGAQSSANDINDSGRVAGWSYNINNFRVRATVWDGTKPTDLGTLGGNSGSAYAINNAGQVVGESAASDNHSHATLWNGGKATSLDNFTYEEGLRIATDINNSGKIVGSFTYPIQGDEYVPSQEGVMWDGIRMTRLNGLSAPQAINGSGQVAGSTIVAESWDDPSIPVPRFVNHAMLWKAATAVDLGPGTASGINDAGLVVGTTEGRAMLWNGASVTDLNNLLDARAISDGWVLESANDINNQGWIVGDAHNSISGLHHAFLLTPIPEPEIYAMFLAGLGLMAGALRSRRRTSSGREKVTNHEQKRTH